MKGLLLSHPTPYHHPQKRSGEIFINCPYWRSQKEEFLESRIMGGII